MCVQRQAASEVLRPVLTDQWGYDFEKRGHRTYLSSSRDSKRPSDQNKPNGKVAVKGSKDSIPAPKLTPSHESYLGKGRGDLY